MGLLLSNIPICICSNSNVPSHIYIWFATSLFVFIEYVKLLPLNRASPWTAARCSDRTICKLLKPEQLVAADGFALFCLLPLLLRHWKIWRHSIMFVPRFTGACYCRTWALQIFRLCVFCLLNLLFVLLSAAAFAQIGFVVSSVSAYVIKCKHCIYDGTNRTEATHCRSY